MSAYKTVAVAGATGNLGPSLVQGLVDAGFTVTALSRSGKTDGLPSQVKSIQVDYTSQDSLVAALKGQDALVSNLPKHDEQNPLIDAAIKAGVKRFLPSEFGSNTAGDEKTAALPVFKGGKIFTQEYLRKKQDQISYTVVVNGGFLDWGLKVGFILKLGGDSTTFFGDGTHKFSTTTLPDVGKAVANILKHPEETKNRAVHIQSATVSQGELLDIAKKVKPGYNPTITNVDLAQLEKDSYAKLEKGEDIPTAMLNFVVLSAVAPGFKNNWADKNDNELLGVKELSREELEKLVAQYV